MLQDPIKSQLSAYLANLAQPIVLEASLDGSDKAREMLALLQDVAALSDKVQVSLEGTSARRPSFLIRRVESRQGVTFAAIPMGHEFTSFVLALLQVGGHPPKTNDETADQIRALSGTYKFEIFVSLSCQNCPEVVQALNMMSVLNPVIEVTTIDGALFEEEVTAKNIMSVPQIYLNGEPFGSGRMDVGQILAKLDTEAPRREAERLKTLAPLDVLVIGGGPAGASAAVYAARKGLRTGVVADRFGGQVMDTAGIENFVSIKETEGPRLSSQLEAHVREYNVEIVSGQRAQQLIPAEHLGGLHEIKLENGAVLRSRTIILATGAHWRHLGVPGEEQYRTKGVAYCPHCDGPFFKGKRVAVAGGGNSGVEAAIDLAGIAAHVTLVQYGPELTADQVLQDKLHSLPNVTVILDALTTEVLGDGVKVTGLRYRDGQGQDQHLDLDGIFVQIGLLPNTKWLRETLTLNAVGEIDIDQHGVTSIPGVFGAGDATTVPYKQIVIAIGEGARSALSAFDYLIRTPAVEEERAAA